MREYDRGNTGSQRYLRCKRSKSGHTTRSASHNRSLTCNNRNHPPSIVRAGCAKALCWGAKGKRGLEVPRTLSARNYRQLAACISRTWTRGRPPRRMLRTKSRGHRHQPRQSRPRRMLRTKSRRHRHPPRQSRPRRMLRTKRRHRHQPRQSRPRRMLRTKSRRHRNQPLQYPTNLQRAKTLGLKIPPMLLARERGDHSHTVCCSA